MSYFDSCDEGAQQKCSLKCGSDNSEQIWELSCQDEKQDRMAVWILDYRFLLSLLLFSKIHGCLVIRTRNIKSWEKVQFFNFCPEFNALRNLFFNLYRINPIVCKTGPFFLHWVRITRTKCYCVQSLKQWKNTKYFVCGNVNLRYNVCSLIINSMNKESCLPYFFLFLSKYMKQWRNQVNSHLIGRITNNGCIDLLLPNSILDIKENQSGSCLVKNRY